MKEECGSKRKTMKYLGVKLQKHSEGPREVILKGGKHVKGNLVLRLNHPHVIFFSLIKPVISMKQ